MITAKQTRREAKQLFRLCLVNGRVDEDRVRKVVQSVLQFRRRGYLALLGYFQRLLKLDHAQHTAEIQSAVPLARGLGDQAPGWTTRCVRFTDKCIVPTQSGVDRGDPHPCWQ